LFFSIIVFFVVVVAFVLGRLCCLLKLNRKRRYLERKGANSTRMGFIQTEVKLAATLRELFGEKRKSMVDIFHIAPTSARTAFLNVIRRINSCQELEGSVYATDQSPEVLAERAFAFQKRDNVSQHFRHCVGAIDGLFIKTQQPRLREVGNVRAYYSGHKKGFGLNMQATCDAQCRIIAFSCNTRLQQMITLPSGIHSCTGTGQNSQSLFLPW